MKLAQRALKEFLLSVIKADTAAADRCDHVRAEPIREETQVIRGGAATLEHTLNGAN